MYGISDKLLLSCILKILLSIFHLILQLFSGHIAAHPPFATTGSSVARSNIFQLESHHRITIEITELLLKSRVVLSVALINRSHP